MNKSTSAPKKQSQVVPDVKNSKLSDVFESVRKCMGDYVPPFTITINTKEVFELYSNKPVEYKGIRKDKMYFGGVMLRKDYVALYLMHLYTHPQTLQTMDASLKKLLKGKSCLHIKNYSPELEKKIRKVVADGVACYRKEGFI